jgi:hypothetical protein
MAFRGRWVGADRSGLAYVGAESVADVSAVIAEALGPKPQVRVTASTPGWDEPMTGIALERGLWCQKDEGFPPVRVDVTS